MIALALNRTSIFGSYVVNKKHKPSKKIGNSELAIPNQVVFYNFAVNNKLPQLHEYVAELKTDILWLRERLQQELSEQQIEQKD